MIEEINEEFSPLLPPHLRQHVEPSNHIVPSVFEKEGNQSFSSDLFSRLLKDRIIFIDDQVDDIMAKLVIAQLLYLQMQDPGKDINVYINSPGGSVTAGLAIYDTMQFVTCDINTYCMGMAASMGAVLLTAGTAGKRYALPNAHVMIHQVSGGAQGTAMDVEKTFEFMLGLNSRLYDIMSHHIGKDADTIKKDSERDKYMTANEAAEYGLIDQVLKSNSHPS